MVCILEGDGGRCTATGGEETCSMEGEVAGAGDVEGDGGGVVLLGQP